ncbi:protein phosphatase 2C domain-containing protein [Comamonas sp. MYb21]|uniref:PP2C family protein-serine/threonine phosphatase n=1 Tax=Comamonas sp. MYb21 TaxID=1848648 RepID=UPI00309D0148
MTGQAHPCAQSSLALVHHSLSHKGDRSYNEDAYCHVRDKHVVSFAVADGMGGAAGGAQASHLAMQAVRAAVLTLDPEQFSAQLRAMSQRIQDEQQSNPRLRQMSTTVVELRIDTYAQKAVWAHWGDSRMYWFRATELMAMTVDHSVVQSLVSAGLLSAQEARSYPQKNVLLGAVGANSEVGPDVLAAPVDVASGDAFLLCTDGIWNCLAPEDIEASLKRSGSVQAWVTDLMDQVERVGQGSNDNFTATGVWITSDGEQTLLLR